MLQPSDAAKIPYSLLWAAFVCYWEYSAWSSGSLLARLWGVPFVSVGLYQLVGRFFYDAYLRARTYYGLTNRRALIVVERGSRQLTSIDLVRADEVQLDERADGTGSISFGKPVETGSGKSSQTIQPPTFTRIPAVQEVFALIGEAQAKRSED